MILKGYFIANIHWLNPEFAPFSEPLFFLLGITITAWPSRKLLCISVPSIQREDLPGKEEPEEYSTSALVVAEIGSSMLFLYLHEVKDQKVLQANRSLLVSSLLEVVAIQVLRLGGLFI